MQSSAMANAAQERVVSFRPRTVLVVLGILLATLALLSLVYLAWHIITWILIAVFLALALDPAMEFFERRGLRRGYATGIVFVLAIGVIAGLGFLLVPPLVDQVRSFVDYVPQVIDDVTAGRGPFGFLQTEYHIVDRVREAIDKQGAGGVLGITGTGLAVARGVLTAVAGVVAIAFLTFFMLLDGRRLVERFYNFLPDRSRPRWRRIGTEIYRTVGGYVTGNILISVIAGVASAIVLFSLGSDYAIALAVVVATVVFVEVGCVKGVIIVVFFIVHQQLENHILQPVIYGRTVQLTPLVVLVSVLIGAELAGVLGALAAIPVAGIVQAVGREFLSNREAAPEPT